MVFHHYIPQKISGLRTNPRTLIFNKCMDYSYRKNITYDLRNELLARDDVPNRGITADTIEGFINRLDNIYSLKPELCFIMGGINDICLGIPVNEIAANLSLTITSLKKHNIRPVIQSTLYMTESMPEWETVNKKVDDLNDLLKKISTDENVQYIDLNRVLSDKNSLRNKNS